MSKATTRAMTNNFHGWGFAHAHTYTLTDTVLPLAPLVRLCLYVQADTLRCLGPHDLGVAEAYARSPTISRGVVLGARPHAWVADALARCVSRVVHSSGSGGLSFTRTPRNTRLAAQRPHRHVRPGASALGESTTCYAHIACLTAFVASPCAASPARTLHIRIAYACITSIWH